MGKITEIPLELLSAIGKAATLGDVLQLRLVCKALAEALMGITFRRIVIDTTGPSRKEGSRLDSLKTLAEIEEHHPVRVLARTLEINRFGLNSNVELDYFRVVCRNLQRVENLVWSWGSYSANQPVAIQALQPILPSLRQVELLAFQGDHMLLLSSLPPLTRLVIDDLYYNSEVGDLVWKETTRLVARSRDTLQELRLSVWPQRCDNPTPSIQDILPRSTSFPKLKSLSLNANLAIRSTSMALPQISSLQSLSLSGGVDRGAWPQEQQNIFVALRQSRIHLQQVTATESPPLIDYFASYENALQEVRIEDSRQRETELDVPRTTLASRFFREVIPRHQSSLTEIGITTEYDEGWAFGDSESNASMFTDPLPMLVSLNIPILMTGMTANHLEAFLNRVLRPSHYPLLRIIDVEIVTGTTRGVAAPGWYASEWSRSAAKEAYETLRDYSLATDRVGAGLAMHWNPPMLYIRTREFCPRVSEGSVRFEPLGTDWDSLYSTLENDEWDW